MISGNGLVTEYFVTGVPVTPSFLTEAKAIQGKHKIIFAEQPIRDTVIFVTNPLKTFDDLYRLAVKIRLSSSKENDDFIFLGQRVLDERKLIVGYIDNRNDVVIKLAQDAAAKGHLLAIQLLKTLVTKNQTFSTARALTAISETAEIAASRTAVALNKETAPADIKIHDQSFVGISSAATAAITKSAPKTEGSADSTAAASAAAASATPEVSPEFGRVGTVPSSNESAHSASSDVAYPFSLFESANLTDVDLLLPSATAGFRRTLS